GNPKNTYGAKGQMPMTRMGIAHVLREKLADAKKYMQEKDDGKNPKFDVELEAMLPAMRGEVPLKMHCTQYDMLTAIEIAKEFGLEFSLEHAWGACDYMDEIVESGCSVCYGPIATYRAPGERRKIDIEAVKILDDRGVNVAIVTDSPILSIESLYHHLGEAVREGLDINRGLRMVTINPAKILGVADRVGSIEVGKDADIAIFDGIVGLDTNAKVKYTIVNGEVVYSC
ncbi:MAG: amidohydrolase family protein, partial [Oscillospiraceae bacterium]